MKKDQSEQDFLLQVKKTLDNSSEQIDEITQARLGAARRRAIEAGRSPAASSVRDFLPSWITRHHSLAATAATMILAAALTLTLYPSRDRMVTTPQLEDLELLSSSDDLDLYQDLDFYLWMEDEQTKG